MFGNVSKVLTTSNNSVMDNHIPHVVEKLTRQTILLIIIAILNHIFLKKYYLYKNIGANFIFLKTNREQEN